jgi:hypothetical protein
MPEIFFNKVFVIPIPFFYLDYEETFDYLEYALSLFYIDKILIFCPEFLEFLLYRLERRLVLSVFLWRRPTGCSFSKLIFYTNWFLSDEWLS